VAALSPKEVRAHFERADSAKTHADRGKVLEDLACYVLEAIPGVTVAERNVMNPFGTEELDIAVWNRMLPEGLWFLQSLLLVECKNWQDPVDGSLISYFASRMGHAGCNDGILFSANGITGTAEQMTGAHYQIMMALNDGRRILVVTRTELDALSSSAEFAEMLQRKRLQLTINRTQLF
jgi:hypothetical protein